MRQKDGLGLHVFVYLFILPLAVVSAAAAAAAATAAAGAAGASGGEQLPSEPLDMAIRSASVAGMGMASALKRLRALIRAQPEGISGYIIPHDDAHLVSFSNTYTIYLHLSMIITAIMSASPSCPDCLLGLLAVHLDEVRLSLSFSFYKFVRFHLNCQLRHQGG